MLLLLCRSHSPAPAAAHHLAATSHPPPPTGQYHTAGGGHHQLAAGRQIVTLHGCPPAVSPAARVQQHQQQSKPVPPRDLPLLTASGTAPPPPPPEPFPASVARSLRNINPTRESLKRINSTIGQTLGEWRTSCQTLVHPQPAPFTSK